MISRYEATLDGVALTSLSPSILITDIQYDEPGRRRETFVPAKTEGGRIVRTYKEKAKVHILFQIRAYETIMRQTICQAICAWARDGKMLQVSDRPGQRLMCVCSEMPTITSALRWTDSLTIGFEAQNPPYWQEDAETKLTLAGSNVSGLLVVPGSAPDTVVEATIIPQAALNEITLRVEDTTLTLTNLNAAVGNRITITYDDNLIQSIKNGNTSILNKRSGADDLKAYCGKSNYTSFTATAACTVIFSARGRWE